jgi:hypothetical protein
MFRRAAHQIKHGAAVFMGRVYVQKAQLIRASGIIGDGGVHRIACIAQANKIHTFDHTAIGDI